MLFTSIQVFILLKCFQHSGFLQIILDYTNLLLKKNKQITVIQMNIKVVHCKKSHYEVYIGRPSKWGNPFTIGTDGSREEVIKKYREWLLQQDNLLEALPELYGKTIACWCSPLACHGDVLSEFAEKLQIAVGEQKIKVYEIKRILSQ